MKKKLRVTVVYNEPSIEGGSMKKFISPTGVLHEGSYDRSTRRETVDLSEAGVLQEVENVRASLKELGYEVSVFNVTDNLVEFVTFLTKERPDLVFNLCESLGHIAIHEMHVAGVYEILGIRYTGSPPMTMGLALDKVRAKELLSYHQIPTPKFVCYRNPSEVNPDDFPLQFPVIVKPSMEDASIGIDADSVVDSIAGLKRRVRFMFQQHDQPVLIEEFIDGRELNVSILGNRKPMTLPISEIDFTALPPDFPKILTYDGKWMKGSPAYNGTKGICPLDLSSSVEKILKETALRVYRLFGCRDYARVDFRLGAGENVYVLEINPNPDLSDDAGFARSSRAYGLTYTDVVKRIVDYALERSY